MSLSSAINAAASGASGRSRVMTIDVGVVVGRFIEITWLGLYSAAGRANKQVEQRKRKVAELHRDVLFDAVTPHAHRQFGARRRTANRSDERWSVDDVDRPETEQLIADAYAGFFRGA